MKYGKILTVIFGLLVAAAIIIIDLRPTKRLQTFFFRYYYLEKLNQFTKIIDPLLEIAYRPKQLIKKIVIKIAPADVQKMVGSLPSPYPAVFLSSTDAPSVPAVVEVDGRSYQATVRIRGKSPRHWQDEQKSLRIDFLSDRPPEGIQTWHLVIPYDRYFIAEAYSQKIAGDLGLPVWHQEPVWAEINGIGGVYLATERVDGGMIERNTFPVGAFYTEAELGGNPSFPFLFASVGSWRAIEHEPGKSVEFALIERLLELVNQADDKTFFKEIPTIIDIDQFLRWQAHAVLTSSDHIDDRHNAQILMNVATGNLTFFLSDPGFYEYGSPADLESRLLQGSYNKLAKRILSNPSFRQRRDQILTEYLNNHQAELVSLVAEEKNKILPWLARDPIKLHSNLRVWWLIRQREEFLKKHWQLLSKILEVKE